MFNVFGTCPKNGFVPKRARQPLAKGGIGGPPSGSQAVPPGSRAGAPQVLGAYPNNNFAGPLALGVLDHSSVRRTVKEQIL